MMPPSTASSSYPAQPPPVSPAPSPAAAPSDPWPGFQKVLRGKTVRPDATTQPQELSREPKIGWVASPSDTSIFICDVADCYLLFPSAAKLSAHQATGHPADVVRTSITWFDPSVEKEAEERERAIQADAAEQARQLEEERLRQAARRSFMPL